MTVPGKKMYSIYLNEENAEYLKSFLETTKNKGGLSGLIDQYVSTMVGPLRASKYKPGEKLTIKQLLKFGLKGLRQKPL